MTLPIVHRVLLQMSDRKHLNKVQPQEEALTYNCISSHARTSVSSQSEQDTHAAYIYFQLLVENQVNLLASDEKKDTKISFFTLVA